MKTNISPSRICAYKILYDVLENKAFSNISVNKHLNSSLKLSSDRALCVNIVYGTLKNRNRLLKIIGRISKTPVEKLDKKEEIILLMSIYQLFYLKKVPDYAIINDAVSMAKFYVGSSVTGFTNAVLRNVQRQKDELLNEREDDFFELMYYEYGYEKWLTKLLCGDYSKEALLEYAKACEMTPSLTVRVNTLKTDDETALNELEKDGIAAEKTYVPHVLKIKGAENVFAKSSFKNGLFFAQDISGAISGFVLGEGSKEEILDLCAAPGAKSFGSAMLNPEAQITSCDISANKLELLKQSARQLGFKNIRTMRSDSTEENPAFINRFEKVICDVPCSGLGVVRRKPEILYNATQPHIKNLRTVQTKCLENAVKYTKHDGTLLYSTCTINKDENERVVEDVLRNNKKLKLSPIILPFELLSSHPEAKDGMLCLNPQKDDSDGFFIAKLIKK